MESVLEHKDWKGTTGGLPWMQRSLVKILAITDQRIIYGIMALVIPFYMLFNKRGFQAQYDFFRYRLLHQPFKAFWCVYLNHFRFGQIIIDRFAVYGDRKFQFEMEGFDLWQRYEHQEDGFVQISSHIGNYELAGYSLKSARKRLNALVFLGETPTVMQNRLRVFTPNNINMVPVMPDMSHIFTLNTALSNGEIVSMPGDRIFGSQKTLSCSFLGSSASFPIGPFMLTLTRKCPLIAVFVMKKDWRTYHIIIREIEVKDKGLKKQEALQQLADHFTQVLEEVVRQYPTQWFNYYDFWQKTS